MNIMSFFKPTFKPQDYSEYLNTPGNNIIYYDKYFSDRKSEIFRDTENFKNITSGAFVFVLDLNSLFLVCEDIKKNTKKAKFDLIIGDSEKVTEETIDELRQRNYMGLIRRVCIFTYYVDNYKNIQKKYPEVKNVVYYPSEVKDFMKRGENKTIIFRTLLLISNNDFYGKYHNIYKELYDNYGKLEAENFNLAKKKALLYLDDLKGYPLRMKTRNKTIKDAYIDIINEFSNVNNNKENIIKAYTYEYNSYYQDFNYSLLRLNQRYINSFSWFMGNVIYCLKNSIYSKGLGQDSNGIFLYKGMRLDIIELINYERFVGKTICFPSFNSTSTDINVAARFSGRGKGVFDDKGDLRSPYTHSKTRIKVEEELNNFNIHSNTGVTEGEGEFGVMFKITYRLNKGQPYCFNIEDENVTQFPGEKERLFLPFTHYFVEKVEINKDDKLCDIELISLGNEFTHNLNTNNNIDSF